MAETETEWVARPPAPVLQPYVERFIGYRLAGDAPGLHRGLPSRHVTFIVAIGPTIDVVRQTDPREPGRRYRGVLSGLQATPALIAHDGVQEGVGIELTPLGFHVLFGAPARVLWSATVEPSELLGGPGDELCDRLQGTHGWPARFAVCDDVLTRFVGERTIADAVGPELSWAWTELVRSGGATPVRDLADEVGWTRQHLTRRFQRELGLGPKLAARIVRFERARRLLQSVPPMVTIAQVAAVCGYYDQAHLNRDFSELAGCSPTEWLREEVASFQDGGPLDPAEWQA